MIIMRLHNVCKHSEFCCSPSFAQVTADSHGIQEGSPACSAWQCTWPSRFPLDTHIFLWLSLRPYWYATQPVTSFERNLTWQWSYSEKGCICMVSWLVSICRCKIEDDYSGYEESYNCTEAETAEGRDSTEKARQTADDWIIACTSHIFINRSSNKKLFFLSQQKFFSVITQYAGKKSWLWFCTLTLLHKDRIVMSP